MILPTSPWSTAAGSVSLCHSTASPPPTACELTRYHHPATEAALATTSMEMHFTEAAVQPSRVGKFVVGLHSRRPPQATPRCSLAGVLPCIPALAQLHWLTGCTNGGFRFVSLSCDGSHKELVLCQLTLRLYCWIERDIWRWRGMAVWECPNNLKSLWHRNALLELMDPGDTVLQVKGLPMPFTHVPFPRINIASAIYITFTTYYLHPRNDATLA
jgi:hypothetical protein